jgi:nucleotide-binding universal stress UspA family protein
MQETRGGDALAPARALLERAGIGYTPAVLLGPVAESIAQYAKDKGCDQIVMGTRGLGALGGMLMGSVTTELLRLTDLPVTLVK